MVCGRWRISGLLAYVGSWLIWRPHLGICVSQCDAENKRMFSKRRHGVMAARVAALRGVAMWRIRGGSGYLVAYWRGSMAWHPSAVIMYQRNVSMYVSIVMACI